MAMATLRRAWSEVSTIIVSDMKSGPSIRQIVMSAPCFFGLPARGGERGGARKEERRGRKGGTRKEEGRDQEGGEERKEGRDQEGGREGQGKRKGGARKEERKEEEIGKKGELRDGGKWRKGFGSLFVISSQTQEQNQDLL